MKIKNIIKNILIILSIIIILGIIFFSIYLGVILTPIKNYNTKLNGKEKITTFYSNDNIKISNPIYDKNKIPINKLNDYTINAFLSIEDKNFYKHNGLNYKRIIKAIINNLKAKEFKEGASTITQQLVKNKYLTNEKTIKRKIKESYLAKKIEKNNSKKEILNEYLNTIYFGNGAYGINNASLKFFNKTADKLSLNESAMLAGIIKSPTNYSPINNYSNSLKRKNIVLTQMLKDNLITKSEFNKCISNKIILSDSSKNDSNDLYINFAINEACKILNINQSKLMNSGYKIYTYKSNKEQEILNNTIKNNKFYNKNKYNNIADSLSMITNNQTHSVSAISGKSKYDLTNILRQPGSLIKPIISIAPGLEEKIITPITQIKDEPINYDNYKPKNVGNKYYDYISVKDAVAKSLNIPTIKICEKIGLKKCKNYAQKCGINFDKYDNGYAIALGGFTKGISLKSITDSYSPFINDGNYITNSLINKIENENGNIIYNRKINKKNVYSKSTAFLMTDILKYSTKYGTSKRLSEFNFDIAGKTGTVAYKKTNYNTDAYSLAYTSNHTISVWLGNYSMNEKFMLNSNNNGGTQATSIIKDVLKNIYKNYKPKNFTIPKEIEKCTIDNKTLKDKHIILLGNKIPKRYTVEEYFAKDNKPLKESDLFTNFTIENFKITTEQNKVKIEFLAKDFLIYKIFKIENNKKSLIKEFTNYNGIFNMYDNNIHYNKEYKYYILAENKYNNKSIKTNTKSIYIYKNYNEILSNRKNYDFIFM